MNQKNQTISATTLEEALQTTKDLAPVAPAGRMQFRLREAIEHDLGWETVITTLNTGRDLAETAEHLAKVWHLEVKEAVLRRLVRGEAYRRRAAAIEELQNAKRKKKAVMAQQQVAEAILLRFRWPLEPRKRKAVVPSGSGAGTPDAGKLGGAQG